MHFSTDNARINANAAERRASRLKPAKPTKAARKSRKKAAPAEPDASSAPDKE